MKKHLSAVVTLGLSSLAFASVGSAQTPNFRDRFRVEVERFQDGAGERPSARMSAAAGHPDRLEIPHVAFEARMAQRERGQEHGQDGAAEDGNGRSHVAASVSASGNTLGIAGGRVNDTVHVAMGRAGDVRQVQERQTQGEDAASGASHAVSPVSPSYLSAHPGSNVEHPHVAMGRMGDVAHVQERQTQGEDAASNVSHAVGSSSMGFERAHVPGAQSQHSPMSRMSSVPQARDRNRPGEEGTSRSRVATTVHTFSNNEP